MTFPTSVPQVAFTASGVSLPTDAAILAGVQADINQAFGGGVNSDLRSPQGQLAQSLTAIVSDTNAQIAAVANNINPDVAAGRWQDAIGRIYFLTRIPASGTLVTATCVGLAGTVIPAGTLAQDANGYLYASTAAVTIPSGGSVSVGFQNQTSGPIACAAGALSIIYSSITGWESITNPAAGALGSNVETQADFENRRRNSVAANAVNSVQSLLGAVLAVPNVLDAYVVDNPSAAAITYGSTTYSIPAHSVVVAVAGGSSPAVAQAIWSKKPVGCGYAGNTSAVVLDTSAQYAPSYPGYTVTWLAPTATPVFVAVRIANNSTLPTNIATLVQNAVVAAFTGADGGLRARIGSTLYAGRFYAGIQALNVNVSILSVFVGLAAAPTATSQAFGIDQLPTISAANISVTLV
ncbi:MAG: baseplate J/gp47 family protein [Rhodospirillales bacterium]|nr:baseplate J/gp47 family protein [Rhodospirillales bacterium]